MRTQGKPMRSSLRAMARKRLRSTKSRRRSLAVASLLMTKATRRTTLIRKAGLSSESPPTEATEPAPVSPAVPRSGSKLAHVIELLRRHDGATLDELTATTGWLAHTTRAALTGLRKRGYEVALNRSDNGRGSFYGVKADLSLSDGPRAARPGEESANSGSAKKPSRRSKPGARRAAR